MVKHDHASKASTGPFFAAGRAISGLVSLVVSLIPQKLFRYFFGFSVKNKLLRKKRSRFCFYTFMTTENGLRPLYLVEEIAKAVGKEISHVYDDLVFLEDAEVLFQFADALPETLYLYLHQEMEKEDFDSLLAKYEIIARQKSIKMIYKGRFTLSPKEKSKEINIQFFPEG